MTNKNDEKKEFANQSIIDRKSSALLLVQCQFPNNFDYIHIFVLFTLDWYTTMGIQYISSLDFYPTPKIVSPFPNVHGNR